MRVVDSSCWIEVFADGPLAERWVSRLAPADEVLVPAIVLYEVFRWLRREAGEEAALRGAAKLQESEVVPLDAGLALAAAEVGRAYRLAMADAVVYATARSRRATLFTSDADFEGLPAVHYLAPSGGG